PCRRRRTAPPSAPPSPSPAPRWRRTPRAPCTSTPAPPGRPPSSGTRRAPRPPDEPPPPQDRAPPEDAPPLRLRPPPHVGTTRRPAGRRQAATPHAHPPGKPRAPEGRVRALLRLP